MSADFDYLRSRFREGGRFLSVQLLIMSVNFGCGLLIVRHLPKNQYALYTIAFSVLSILNNIGNTGIISALSSIGGRIWQDKARLGSLMNTALQFRKQVTAVFVLPIIGLMAWQLYTGSAGWLSLLLIILLVIPAGWAGIKSGVYLTVSRLHKQIASLQHIELQAGLFKLICTALLILCFRQEAWWFILPASLALSWQVIRLRQLTVTLADPAAVPSAEYRQRILELFRPNILNVVYWSFQGQVTFILCSLFATSENIAEFGALGRLYLIFEFVQSVLNNYTFPKLAKTQLPNQILRIAMRSLGFYAVISGGLVLLSYLFPRTILSILGPNYMNLEHDLVLFMCVSILNIIQGLMYNLAANRGWITQNYLYLPFTLSVQILWLVYIPVHSVHEILQFQLVSIVPAFLLNTFMFSYGFFKYKTDYRVEHAGI